MACGTQGFPFSQNEGGHFRGTMDCPEHAALSYILCSIGIFQNISDVTVRSLRTLRNLGSMCLVEGVICLLAGCGSTLCIQRLCVTLGEVMAATQVCIWIGNMHSQDALFFAGCALSAHCCPAHWQENTAVRSPCRGSELKMEYNVARLLCVLLWTNCLRMCEQYLILFTNVLRNKMAGWPRLQSIFGGRV